MLANTIQLQQISTQTIRDEISLRLNIAAQKIKQIEYWKHQLWINISGKGGKILSYRILPSWIRQTFKLIRNCETLEQIQEVGNLLKVETQRFSQYYAAEDINKLRNFWALKYKDLKAKYEAEEPMRRHKKEAQEWLERWQGIAQTCQSHKCLEHGYIMVSMQKEQFADLPEIIDQVMEALNMRALELEKARLKVRSKDS